MEMQDPLQTIVTNVPDWLSRLDDLKNQIAQRQIELAQLTEAERPPTARSLRNKGSTESLRPKDQHENPFLTQDEAGEKEPVQNPFHTPVKEHGAFTPTSPNLADSPTILPAAGEPQSNGTSSKQTAKVASRNVEQLQLQASKRLASLPQNGTSAGVSPAVPQFGVPLKSTGFLTRKRKGSTGSDETAIQKYRTRSMIIVYYDSAVQIAFEELVRFVSTARNAMRKQKMANRMAEMRRLAELEAEREEAMLKQGGHDEMITADPDEEDDDEEYTLPRLNFVSTRNMGPSMDGMRGSATQNANRGMPTLMSRMKPSWKDDRLSVYEDLDKDLEYCQSMCEHAAHQFLRDGDCNEEIESIKRRLVEVKETSGKQIKVAEEAEEAVSGGLSPRGANSAHAAAASPAPALAKMSVDEHQADDALDVDDDEDEDENIPPPKLVFKSARSYVH